MKFMRIEKMTTKVLPLGSIFFYLYLKMLTESSLYSIILI